MANDLFNILLDSDEMK